MEQIKKKSLRSYPETYLRLLASSFMLITNMSLAAAFLSIFAYDLDPSGILVGLVTSAWFLSRIFTEIPSGFLADKIGRYRLLVLGLILSAVGPLICSLANTIHMLIAGRAIWGFGTALFFLSSSTIIFDLFPSNVMGRALGTFQSLELIGSFIGAPIGGFMAGFLGYRGVFVVSALLSTLAALNAYSSRELRQMRTAEHGGNISISSLKEVFPGIKNTKLTTIYISSLLRMLIMMGIASTMFPLYLNLHLNISIELIGIIISVRTLGMVISTGVSGRLSDVVGRKPLIISGMLIESFSLLAYIYVFSPELLMCMAFIEGFGRGTVFTTLMVLLSEIAPPSLRGSAMGVYRTFMDIGGFIGPPLFMAIYEVEGPHISFISAALIMLITSLIIAATKYPRRLV